jgi:hypothetical protein
VAEQVWRLDYAASFHGGARDFAVGSVSASSKCPIFSILLLRMYVEVMTRKVGDAPRRPELLDQVLTDQNIGLLADDAAYDPRKCRDAIAARGAHAVIPSRKNVKP